MARNHPDFIEAYYAYAKDSFAPDKFHYWAGLMMIAAALERKCWAVQVTPAGAMVMHHPNMYFMFIALPAEGKTTAGDRARDFLLEIVDEQGKINFIPPNITDAAFWEAVKCKKAFYVGEQKYEHNSAFYYAGEASNALREIKGGGDIFPFITNVYDCKPMAKSTKKDGVTAIDNPCMNVLACSTPDNLKNMLSDTSFMGGFASRFTYILFDEQIIRNTEWIEYSGQVAPDWRNSPKAVSLIQDLNDISRMTGRFTTTAKWRQSFKEFFPENDRARYAMSSEKEQALVGRKHTSIIKMSMLVAASESSERVLHNRHWYRARQLVESLEASHKKVIALTHDARSASGLSAIILDELKKTGGHQAISKLKRVILKSGADTDSINKTLDYMVKESHELVIEPIDGDSCYRLTGKT